MTKPDRVRDGGTETGREAKKKKRNLPPSPSPSGEVHPPFCEPDDGAEAEREAKKKRNSTGEEQEVHPPFCEPGDQAAPQHAPPEMTGDQDESVSETLIPKSPLTKPFIPDELSDENVYPEVHTAFEGALHKYKAKIGRRYHLFTFQNEGKLAPSYLFNHPRLLPIRERAKKAVLYAAKSIIRLSSSLDGRPLADCCGVWIKWDQQNKTGIVLTTAHLIRTKHPTKDHWEGRDEYNKKADVTAHLLDDTTTKAHFLYHQQHYDLAFFEVRVEDSVQVASFNGSIQCGQDVFQLGRDDRMNLRITHGMVEDWNPGSKERHHYMYFLHQKNDYLPHQKNDAYPPYQKKDDSLCDDDGGPIIDLDGKVVGLVNKHLKKSFLPSCILDKCVDLWCEFGCIPRLHFGMRFTSIKLLDPIHVEKLWRRYKIENGLIVQEVSKESHAEKLGIYMGDIIERFNGECISSTVQLESMLLGRCREHLDQGNRLYANIDVSIQVFLTEERLRRMINLTVKVSDGGEVIIRRTCPITEGTPISGQFSQHVAGTINHGDPAVPLVDGTDLSVRIPRKLKTQLNELHAKRNLRLEKIDVQIKCIEKMCNMMFLDLKKTLYAAHPSFVELERTNSMSTSDSTLHRLAGKVHALNQEKKQGLLKY